MRKKLTTHGLQHDKSYGEFVADTRSDPDWVILKLGEREVIRQAKQSNGIVYQKSMLNPSNGKLVYKLQYHEVISNDLVQWTTYDSEAEIGAIRLKLGELRNCLGMGTSP